MFEIVKAKIFCPKLRAQFEEFHASSQCGLPDDGVVSHLIFGLFGIS